MDTPTPSTTNATTPTPDQLRAVLTAAAEVLGARQDRMLGVEEWAALARAVAACHGVKTGDLLTEHDLDDIAERGLHWDASADGPLAAADDD